MSKQIRFNAFEMNCIAHQSPGLWRHPQDRSREYKDLEYWKKALVTTLVHSPDKILIVII